MGKKKVTEAWACRDTTRPGMAWLQYGKEPYLDNDGDWLSDDRTPETNNRFDLVEGPSLPDDIAPGQCKRVRITVEVIEYE